MTSNRLTLSAFAVAAIIPLLAMTSPVFAQSPKSAGHHSSSKSHKNSPKHATGKHLGYAKSHHSSSR